MIISQQENYERMKALVTELKRQSEKIRLGMYECILFLLKVSHIRV